MAKDGASDAHGERVHGGAAKFIRQKMIKIGENDIGEYVIGVWIGWDKVGGIYMGSLFHHR